MTRRFDPGSRRGRPTHRDSFRHGQTRDRKVYTARPGSVWGFPTRSTLPTPGVGPRLDLPTEPSWSKQEGRSWSLSPFYERSCLEGSETDPDVHTCG